MRDKLTVERMIFWSEKIERYTKGKSPDDVMENDMLAEACVFSLSQIGELSHRISKKFAEKNPQIPWRALYGLRNKIVHEYDGLQLTLIWEIIFEDIPRVKKELKAIFQ
jgi:uncharacterized protein with HEPN domain